MSGNLRRPSATWAYFAAVWTGIALFDATQTVVVMRAEGMHHRWATLFASIFLSWLPWAVSTPFVLRLGRRYPPVHLRPWWKWAVHGGACLAMCLFYATWHAGFERLLDPWMDMSHPAYLHIVRAKFLNGLLSSFILYATMLLVGQMIDSRRRLVAQQMETVRLNEQLSREQLNALRRQIEPHFLFNTLNGIAGLIREQKNDAAVAMLAGLSDFLRHSFQNSSQQVPLAEELEFLQKYLEIEKMRFGERLQLTLDVPPELLNAQVPTLMLQPMVENSIKHGISKRVAGGEIRVNASRLNGMLTFRVYNDGPGLAADWESATGGVGIANVRTRLHGLYGERFVFRIESQPPGGVAVTLTVPYQEA
jgi:two-component sensor histidine kinase